MKYLGIDYGDARTGVSISDEMLFLARTLCTLKNSSIEDCANQLSEIIKENNISLIVMGYPKNMNGTIGERCEKVELLAEKIKENNDVEIKFWDERLSTVSAYNMFNEVNFNGAKKRRKVIDSVSAVIILQGYLDSLK